MMLLTFIGFYSILIAWLSYGFDKVNTFDETGKKETTFSVIVPFRNELAHLPQLLESITALNYPLDAFELLLVDDDSTDESALIIKHFKTHHPAVTIHILQNKRSSNSPKKDAIETAIHIAKHDWIVTTDADCVLPNEWLSSFDAIIEKEQPKMVLAPVTYSITDSFFEYFQLLDFLSLQAATIGSYGVKKPFMSNGANLAYTKTSFHEVKAFDGNNHIASGDDVFLLEKYVQQFPNEVSYLKTKKALVKTYPETSVNGLISQRIRWASKSSNYSLFAGKAIGIIILLGNLMFCIAPIVYFLNFISLTQLCIVFGLKISIDALLLSKILRFTSQPFKFGYYLLSSCLYPFFSFYVAIVSVFTTYTWKGREFEK